MQKARIGKDVIGPAVRIAGSTGRIATSWMNSGVPGVNDISIFSRRALFVALPTRPVPSGQIISIFSVDNKISSIAFLTFLNAG